MSPVPPQLKSQISSAAAVEREEEEEEEDQLLSSQQVDNDVATGNADEGKEVEEGDLDDISEATLVTPPTPPQIVSTPARNPDEDLEDLLATGTFETVSVVEKT